MSILGTKKAVAAYNGGYYLPSVSDEGILSWSPTVEGMAPIPEVNVRGPQGSDASVTAEAVQAVVPIAWLGDYVKAEVAKGNNYQLAVGQGAKANGVSGTAVGVYAKTMTNHGTAYGYDSVSNGLYSVALGYDTDSTGEYAVALGSKSKSNKPASLTIGAQFAETVDGQNVTNHCTTEGTGSITIGAGANTKNNGDIESTNSITIGCKASNTAADSIVLGAQASGAGASSITLGTAATSSYPTSITVGSQFTETSDSGDTTYTCSTQGAGSITIGAGANTKNNGDKESSNSVTIGCKASNSGADSVVLGASSSNEGGGNVVIGGESVANGTCNVNIGYKTNKMTGSSNVALGYYTNSGDSCVSIGSFSTAGNNSVSLGRYSYSNVFCVALGDSARAEAGKNIAIGANAKVSDYGATVIRSTAADGTYTQLYFSGANTPLANRYFPTAWEQKQDVDPETNEPLLDDNGDPVMVDDKDKPIAGDAMMGFVTVKNGEIIARGANMLSALFPYYTGDDENPFAPTTMSLRPGDEPQEVMVFHPSDLDLPVEEPEETEEPEVGESEPAKYVPLPVYPIVEPEIEEI